MSDLNIFWVDLVLDSRPFEKLRTQLLGPINFYGENEHIQSKCKTLRYLKSNNIVVPANCVVSPIADPFASIFDERLSLRIWQLSIVIATDVSIDQVNTPLFGHGPYFASLPSKSVILKGHLSWRASLLFTNRLSILQSTKTANDYEASFKRSMASIPVPIQLRFGSSVEDGILKMENAFSEIAMVALVLPEDQEFVRNGAYEIWYPDEFNNFKYELLAIFTC